MATNLRFKSEFVEIHLALHITRSQMSADGAILTDSREVSIFYDLVAALLAGRHSLALHSFHTYSSVSAKPLPGMIPMSEDLPF